MSLCCLSSILVLSLKEFDCGHSIPYHLELEVLPWRFRATSTVQIHYSTIQANTKGYITKQNQPASSPIPTPLTAPSAKQHLPPQPKPKIHWAT